MSLLRLAYEKMVASILRDLCLPVFLSGLLVLKKSVAMVWITQMRDLYGAELMTLDVVSENLPTIMSVTWN